ncbi:hemerythrin domain-containing protein [Planktothrix sp. FACHB-1355]|uniref:Hemerythrin domain-containing protein n=1 Tax=Aerosakkonema funiforme FACHB-1375 TaxID=2949571 RepID=A0A926ZH41_9CYAN|nr:MULTISPECIES: hemerythrin domain-containing protein [Oscillatoriales]MBD2182630.1 hemerythrin domain-containing protein [Aerosakkonema funiforme FACHB-1375]MBD3561036.1 hemerythrin domain-containing protein [Planktothrix sp. FACHB-1355]
MDAVELIKSDHRKVEKIFSQIEKTEDPDKLYEYFNELYTELNVHAQAEELTLYPAMRDHQETEDLVEEAEEEHDEAKILLEEIKSLSPSSPEFKEKIRQLKEEVLHHVEEEESEILPQVSEYMSEAELNQVAEEFQDTKSRLQDDISEAASR